MKIYRVASIAEAQALATAFLKDGSYDWFRGQVQNWPLLSTFMRRPDSEHDEILAKMARFERWARTTTGLEELVSTPDSLHAIAQHYGMPTNFVDFTTEPAVAAYFASEREPDEAGAESCILCLNTADLLAMWKHMPREYPVPECLRLDVPNLWRLEAQQGVFLFCPYAHFENIYDLDRIVFPYSGPLEGPTRDEIYPPRKSSLEELLDQYFMTERMRKGLQSFEEQVTKGRMVSVGPSHSHRWAPDVVGESGPPSHESWSPHLLQSWIRKQREPLAHVKTDVHVQLNVNVNSIDSTDFQQTLRADITAKVKEIAEMRGNLVDWNLVLHDTGAHPAPAPNASKTLARLWDGLRDLPCDLDDIAAGIANCILVWLAYRKLASQRMWDPVERASSMVLGDCIRVEFGSADGAYSQGYASQGELLAATREDILDFVNPGHRERLRNNISALLQAVYAPERLFDFPRFARVFVREIAPTQLLTARRGAVFYSPARLVGFGHP